MNINAMSTHSQGFTLGQSFSAKDSAEAFASFIVNRAGNGAVDDVKGTEAAQIATDSGNLGQQGSSKNKPDAETTDKLKNALGGTINYLSEKFGSSAANTVMGVVLKRIGSDEVNENSLGKGFLSAVKFVDQHFGVSEGDKLINQINGDLNDSINSFFDNGLNEKFIASTTPINATAIDGAKLTAQDETQNADSMVSDLKKMLDDLKKTRPNSASNSIADASGDIKNQQKAYASPYFESPMLEPGLMVDTQV